MASQVGLLKSYQLSKVTGIATIASISSAYFLVRKILYNSTRLKSTENQRQARLIVITGCDTGLGYSMSVWGAKLGYKVLAGCLNAKGEGPQRLRTDFPGQVFVEGVNVTDKNSLQNFHGQCKKILEDHEDNLRLWAIITNAAVCTMGEFLWQTQAQREHQFNVNFWGTTNFVHEFRESLLQSKARVIVISSDCSQHPLPFLSTYCASKAALQSWAQSFRFEVAKYGVHVTTYHPSDFIQRSGLLSNVGMQYKQMSAEMNESDKIFYGDYFNNFMNKKQETFTSNKKKCITVVDSKRHRYSFEHLLESDIARTPIYRDCTWAEKFYHTLCLALPQKYLDKIVTSLLNPDDIKWNEKN